MKKNILQKLNVVLSALGSIEVRGKANLANLSGSIAIIEEIGAELAKFEFVENNDGQL